MSVGTRARMRSLAIGIVCVAALVIVGGLGLSPAWFAPWPIRLGRLAETTVLAIFLVAAVALADRAADGGAPRLPVYGFAVVFGSFVGGGLGWSAGVTHGVHAFTPPGEVLSPQFAIFRRIDLAIVGILVGGLATFVHVNRRTSLAARQRQHDAEQARASAERRTLESQFQALQARVEPAFLFDTLRRVRTLYRFDAMQGGAMLEDLIIYLRAALPHMRESASTVEQEATLTRSWLDIVGRSAKAWSISVAVSDAARAVRMPALVLLPLAQAAAEAGAADRDFDLRIDARIQDDRLRLELASSTDGLARADGPSRLLAQVDERLRALHGERATFETRRHGAGSVAVVGLPIEPSPGTVEPPGRRLHDSAA